MWYQAPPKPHPPNMPLLLSWEDTGGLDVTSLNTDTKVGYYHKLILYMHTHTHTHTHTHRIRRQSSSSSTTSASSGEERDDAVTTINTTSGCVNPRPSTRPPPTAVGRGSSNNSGASAAATSTCVVSCSDDLILTPSSGDATSNLINKDWLPILNSTLNTLPLPLLFPPNFTSSAAPIRLDADSVNPALQLLTAPQSSSSVTSLQTAASKPPSSSSSGQPVSVITSRGALPIPPYQQFQPSSELNSDPFLPPLPICELSWTEEAS